MTPAERIRLERHKRRLRAADRGQLSDWVDDAVQQAQLENKRKAEAAMREHDRKHKDRRAVEKAICIPRLADRAFRSGVRGFDTAEDYFREWLERQHERPAVSRSG